MVVLFIFTAAAVPSLWAHLSVNRKVKIVLRETCTWDYDYSINFDLSVSSSYLFPASFTFNSVTDSPRYNTLTSCNRVLLGIITNVLLSLMFLKFNMTSYYFAVELITKWC